MVAASGGGPTPSYQNIMAGEQSNKPKNVQGGGSQKGGPVLGVEWQAKIRGQCLPRALNKPRFVILPNKLEEYRGYMKDHALICKFIGI